MEGKIKIPQKIKDRLAEVSKVLGEDIMRSSDLDAEFSEAFSRDQIKEKYKERYLTYRKLLPKVKSENGGGSTPTRAEIQKLQTWIRALNNLDTYIETHKTEGSVLRDRQATVFEDIRDAFEKGLIKGYVKLPTGVGKTVLFSQIVEAMGLKTLILVPTKILVGQTGEKLEAFTGLDYGEYSSMKKNLTGDVDIMTYQSFVSLVSRDAIDSAQYELVIEDEVHRALGDETSEALAQLNGVKIGFTATPEFKKKKVSDQLPTLYHEISVKEAAETGLISRFKCIVAKTDVDLSKIAVVQGDYKKEDVEKAVNIKVRNKAAVDLYKSAFVDKLAVAYCSGLDHAKDVLAEFKAQNISAEIISGNTLDKDRAEILKRFSNGMTKVLVNARVLIEGFDEPRASVCLNLHPTLSKVDAEQRAGRVLRLDKEDPEKWGMVVDFIDKNSARPAITFAEIVGAAEVEKVDVERDWGERESSEGGRKRLPHVDISGIEIVYDTEEVMQIASANEQLRDANTFEQAPEGWRTAKSLSLELSSDPSTIKKYTELFRLNNPEWFREYLASKMITEYYSPELVGIIVTHFTEMNASAPEGWRTAFSLKDELRANPASIKDRAEKFREQNPEWFKKFKSRNGMAENYHPDLVKILVEESLEINEVAPEGWRTANNLMSDISSNINTVKKYVDNFRKSNPEWFRNYKSRTSIIEHYAPELVSKIIKHFTESATLAPEGWRNAKSLGKELKTDPTKGLRSFVEIYRNSNPEWFQKFRSGFVSSEHFSPELVEKIKEHFGKREKK